MPGTLPRMAPDPPRDSRDGSTSTFQLDSILAMRRKLGVTALLFVAVASGGGIAEELRGIVLRWDQEFGALHLEQSTGDEAVVPISAETKVVAAFGNLTDGKIFEPGETVVVSREGGESILIVIEAPGQHTEITPGEIVDVTDGTPTSPPVASSPSPEPATEAVPHAAEPTSLEEPEEEGVPTDRKNLKEPRDLPVTNVLEQ